MLSSRARQFMFRAALLTASSVLLAATTAPSGEATAPSPPPQVRPPKASKLSGPLHPLAGSAQSLAQQGLAFDPEALPGQLKALARARLLRIDDRGRVLVDISYLGSTERVRARLEGRGARVQRVNDEERLIQAEVSAARLHEIAGLPEVHRVRLPTYPRAQVGAVTTQGDAVLNADDVRAAFGVDGTGVRVGVISDGVAGLTQAHTLGDLPAVNITTCNVVPANAALKFVPQLGIFESRDPRWAFAGAEGTAILEIVHDLAPGAELWFGYFGAYLTNYGTKEDFMAAVDCLAQHVDILVDDLLVLNDGPYDGSSPVSLNSAAALNNPANPIRGFYKAVGNEALEHYQGAFVDSGQDWTAADLGPPTPPGDFWDLHRFAGTPDTSDASIAPVCGCADTIGLPPGGFLHASLQWNDLFGASNNDYDLFLRNRTTGQFVGLGGGAEQNGDDDPVEELLYFNDSFSTQTLDLYIGNYNGGAAPRTFELFLFCPCVTLIGNGAIHNYNTPGSSVPNNSDAGGGVLSLGAVPASSPGTIQPYSSRGPTNDGRTKPDGVATDAVSVTGAGGFGSPFAGTSAAAPHAAAIAALLLQCNPALRSGDEGDTPASERDALRAFLLDNAVDLGPPGIDTTYGAGRLDALASAGAIDCDDPDGDGVRDGHEAWLGTDPSLPDTDADGCTDGQEVGPMPSRGGRRNPLNPYDFFDTPLPAGPPGTGSRDRIISAADLFGVVAKFGTFAGGPPTAAGQVYNSAFDRTLAGPDPWDLAAGNGSIAAEDIFFIVVQFGHSCAPS